MQPRLLDSIHEDVPAMDDDFRNSFVLNLIADDDETLEEFLRDIGSDRMADWARHRDGTRKTWNELDSEEHGSELWRALLEWTQRSQEAEFLLAEAGLVDPEVPTWEAKMRELEEAGKTDSFEYAKAKCYGDYYRAALIVMQRRQEDDDGASV